MTVLLRLLCPLLVGIVLSGCATWVRLEEPLVEGPGKSFTIQMPAGWMRAAMVTNRLLVTRDGTGIQLIEVVKRSHQKAFPRIKEKTRPDMLPSELAELVIAETKSQEGMSGLKVLSNAPADVAQTTGFRLHLQMKNPDGLRYEAVVYGFVDENGFYQLAFRAPSLHYFQRDLPAFEQAVKSFRLAASGT